MIRLVVEGADRFILGKLRAPTKVGCEIVRAERGNSMTIDQTELLDLLFKAGIGALLTILFRILTGPVLDSITGAWLVSVLSHLPQGRREFIGVWSVTWTTDSENYPEKNRDFVCISHFWMFATFRAKFSSARGVQTYEFFGRWEGNALSGRWYDKGSSRGYHGTFSVVLEGDRRKAIGQWLGYSSAGDVRNGALVLKAVQPSGPTQR